jgi:hypothetical protein
VNPSPGRCRHLEALHGFAVKQHAAGAEVLLESVEGDRGGQHAGADSRLGGVFVAHAAGNAGDRSTISASRFPRGRPIRITQRGTSCPTTAMPVAELHRLRLGDILYPGNSGCAGARGGGGAPGPCQGEVTAAAMKHYHGPKRPHRTRIFLCDLHAPRGRRTPHRRRPSRARATAGKGRVLGGGLGAAARRARHGRLVAHPCATNWGQRPDIAASSGRVPDSAHGIAVTAPSNKLCDQC